MAARDYSEDDDYYTQGFERDGVVSVWVGLRGDEGDGDQDVLQDLCGVGYYRLDDQEGNSFNFEMKSLDELLSDISYSASFAQEVVAVANEKGIREARWVIVQYDFDYDPSKVARVIADDPVFLGSFVYSLNDELR